LPVTGYAHVDNMLQKRSDNTPQGTSALTNKFTKRMYASTI